MAKNEGEFRIVKEIPATAKLRQSRRGPQTCARWDALRALKVGQILEIDYASIEDEIGLDSLRTGAYLVARFNGMKISLMTDRKNGMFYITRIA